MNKQSVASDDNFFAPRRCMRDPIPDIYVSLGLLEEAIDAHLSGEHGTAGALIAAANMPTVREWTESLWGSKSRNPDQRNYHRYREVTGSPSYIPFDQRHAVRMPSSQEKRAVIERFGHNCAFCGVPVISEDVRNALRKVYPDSLEWGRTNSTQHAAFQCMWLQFDHVLPHSRGGDSSLENVIITCAPCNYGRWNRTLEELGLIDPRAIRIVKTDFDGLERLFVKK